MNAEARARAERLFVPVAVAVLALAIRALHAPAVFLGASVQLRDPDSYYHMRRILFTLVNFPTTLGVDPYLAPPQGARAIWPPLFDVAAAWLLRPLWTPGGELAVERAAAWLPPMLGALAALAVYFVGRRIFDPVVGYSRVVESDLGRRSLLMWKIDEDINTDSNADTAAGAKTTICHIPPSNPTRSAAAIATTAVRRRRVVTTTRPCAA